jgi:hypothetical protein
MPSSECNAIDGFREEDFIKGGLSISAAQLGDNEVWER